MVRNNRCAFLMSSCDDYEDLWEPFFECLDKFSKGLDDSISLSVYLNTEKKQFHPKKNLDINVVTLNQKEDKKLPWSKRLIDVLKRLQEEYVFLVLDDYFVCDEIAWNLFDEILEIMDNDRSIASFQLFGTRARNNAPELYEKSTELKYSLMERDGRKTHFVPTIWRKSILLKWLRPWESIWAFESCGSARARRWNYPEKVMVVDNPPVYDYIWIRNCSAVINGKWLAEKELIEFFEQNEILVDWNRREKMTYEEYHSITMSDIFRRYSPGEFLVKCINRVRSFF